MKKTRIFIAFLMVVMLLVFTGCAGDNGTDGDLNNGTTTGSGIMDDVEQGLDDVGDDIRDSVDNMDGNSTNGTGTGNLNTTGSSVNNN